MLCINLKKNKTIKSELKRGFYRTLRMSKNKIEIINHKCVNLNSDDKENN